MAKKKKQVWKLIAITKSFCTPIILCEQSKVFNIKLKKTFKNNFCCYYSVGH